MRLKEYPIGNQISLSEDGDFVITVAERHLKLGRLVAFFESKEENELKTKSRSSKEVLTFQQFATIPK